MMGKMAEEMAGVIRMAMVGMMEQQKQRRQSQGINEGPWGINLRGDLGDDGDGGRDTG